MHSRGEGLAVWCLEFRVGEFGFVVGEFGISVEAVRFAAQCLVSSVQDVA